MNFSSLILEFLKQQGSVPVPGFGTFYLKKTNALVDADGQNILPPGKEVAFRTDISSADTGFAKFIAEQKNIPVIDAEIEVKKQSNFWYSTLEKDGEFVLENVGTFILDDSRIHFTGKRTENLSPDFYGLEEINLSEIKNSNNSVKKGDRTTSYRFSKAVYWAVPLILALSALAYFAFAQPEQLFGTASFKNGLEKKPVQKIVKDSVKTDSAKTINPALDSAKTDSLKSAAIAPVPVKKWTSKKYSKSKWKKSKKRQNR
ncbi:MAG: HU domain-containing protein [Kaistella sp.]